ncbi:MAG: helix-turn-helix domain-containing protein [Candidatus Dactylopiibacterium sp.]|nr:helix-turn-helix domain-containing protein [Candidatus Dactylopiibacterium sp.]
MYRLRSTRALDVDAHAASLSGWEQRYDQLSAGRFCGGLTEFWTAHGQVFLEQAGRAVRQSCRVWPDALWFGIPVRHDGTRMDGRELPAGAILVRPADAGFELVTPDGHEIFGVVVRQQALAAHCARLGLDIDWPRLQHAGWLQVGEAARERAVASLRGLFMALPGQAVQAGLALHAEARREIEETLLGLLLPFVVCAEPAPGRCAGQARRRRTVAQILDHARGHPDWVPAVPELCERFHLCRRSLQYAFEENLGVSPAVYLRAMRLNGARRALREGAASVQDAAAAWGFWNLSQFSADYRHFFGERPSDTLRDAAGISLRYPRRHA